MKFLNFCIKLQMFCPQLCQPRDNGELIYKEAETTIVFPPMAGVLTNTNMKARSMI